MYNWIWFMVATTAVGIILFIPLIFHFTGFELKGVSGDEGDLYLTGGGMTLFVLSILLEIFSLAGWVGITCDTLSARNKYYELQERYKMYSAVIMDKDLINIYTIEGIAEYNQSIVSAKSSVSTWGNWSVWSAYDVDSLQYILLPSTGIPAGEESNETFNT